MGYEDLGIHSIMMQDRIRTLAFKKAISKVVQPGDTVVDIGAGTGILSLFALLAGAKKVYLIERTKIIEIAKEVARDNGFFNKITFVKADSRDIDLPERVDCIISEMIGCGGIDEELPEILLDARKRLLKRNGRMIPSGITVSACPVTLDGFYRQINFWRSKPYKLNYQAAAQIGSNRIIYRRIRPSQALGHSRLLWSMDLLKSRRLAGKRILRFRVIKDGLFGGMAFWFEARLAKGIFLANSPSCPKTHWVQMVLPNGRPVFVKNGDTIKFSFSGNPAVWPFSWRFRVCRAGKMPVEFMQTTIKGDILSKDSIKRHARHARLTISDDGRIDMAILRLCDGKHTADEIVETMRKRWPDKFSDFERAAARVISLAESYEMKPVLAQSRMKA